ncbi:MAG: DNA cytosine methyltransferase, partial [Pseudomonadota bacterium]
KTLRRIAHGIMKFVVNNPSPFIVPMSFSNAPVSAADPLQTITTQGNRHNLVVPHITKFRNGAIGHDMADPLATVTANSFIKRPGGSAPLGLVEARLEKRGPYDHAPNWHCKSCDEEWFDHYADTPESINSMLPPECARCGTEDNATWIGSPEQVLAPVITYAQQGGANRSVEDPHHTICANSKDQNCVAAAVLTPFYGDKNGRPRSANGVDEPLRTQTLENRFGAVMAFMQKFAENGKGYDPETPLHTVMAGAPRHAIVTAHIEQANGGPNNTNLAGRAADDPLSTVATTGSQQRLVTSNLIKLRGTSDEQVRGSGASVDEPLNTISSGGIHAAEVRAFLIKYYGNEQDGHGLDNPLGTVTVQDRFGLVTVTIDGEEYVIVDIGMRMLTPRELFNAQGFPADYIIDRDATGAPITKTAQVAKCGNSVCPPLAEAIVRAQFPEIIEAQGAQAA